MSSLCPMALAPVLLLPLAGALLSPSEGDRDRGSGRGRDRDRGSGRGRDRDRGSGRGLSLVFPSLTSRKISPQLDDGSFEKKQVKEYLTDPV